MVEPDYYAKNGLSPLKAFEQGLLSKEEYIGFCKGNIIKYVIRAGDKEEDALMDIVKALDYLHYLHKALKKPTDKEEEFEFKTPQTNVDELSKLKKSLADFKKEYNIP